jgi:beta-glucosidase
MKTQAVICVVASVLCTVSSQSSFPWLNMSLPYPTRTALLIQALNVTEKIGLMSNDNYAVDRLQVPYYDFWSEALHGVAWADVATVFPQSISLGASFDVDLAHAIGDVIAMEARAKHQDALGPQNNTGKGCIGFRHSNQCVRV